MPLTPEVAAEALADAWRAGWTATPYYLQNEASPDDLPSEFAEVYVLEEDGFQETMGPVGARKFARRGRVVVRIAVQPVSGIERATTLAGLARAVFEGKTIEGVRLYGGRIYHVGNDGRRHLVNVEVPFAYEEHK